MALKNRLANALHDRALTKAVARYLRGTLLDIGCGLKPYAPLVRPWIERHIGIDHPDSPHGDGGLDAFATAYALPVADASVDSVLCTAVLEHLEEPQMAIDAAWRCLKPGGVAVYTAPFIWHIHEEPRDFYRFSRYGLQYMLEKAGFEVEHLEALSGFWVTCGQMLVYYLYRFNRGPLRWLGLIAAAGVVIQLLAYLLDRVDRAEQWTWMYLVVARKPDSNNQTQS
jgi:SAM-dependent methyltransferase